MSKYSLFFCVICITFLASCSNYSKVLKSNDPEVKREAADKYFEKNDFVRAAQLYEEVIILQKGIKNLENVYYRFAQCQYEMKDYYSAAHYFKSFSESYTNSPLREDAAYMVALSYFQDSPQYRLDQENTTKAIEAFQLFVTQYPNSKYLPEVNHYVSELRRKLEIKAFEAANLYYNTSDYRAASIAFQNILKDFPDTKDIEKIKFLILKSNYELAQKSIESKKKERFEKAIKSYYDFVEEYGNSKFKNEAENMFDNATKQLKLINNQENLTKK